ncbi:MAG TPA: DinB family protein [Candidatus Eremiobacteraceae bacterium]|nr:DinB family protein [Candidatus Eremiobacteraceae bacterium]
MRVKNWPAMWAGALLSLAAISAFAQAAAPAAPATLTSQEREAALKQFETTRDNFLKSIAGLSQAQWTFKPAPDRWSVAEVAEHITVSESTLLGLVQKQIMTSPATPEKREQVKGRDELILQKVPDRSQKVQAPEFLRPTGRWATEADLTKAFEESRKATMDYVRSTDDDLRDHFFDHPMLGTMDGYQWLLLISAHSARHTAQIEEVKADPNFPKN